MTLVKTHIIIPSLRCSVIGHLVTILRCAPFPVTTPVKYLLTNVYKLDEDRLYVTYFEGDPKSGLDPDIEARNHWLDVGVAESHIIPGSAKDNFWGTVGPTFVMTLSQPDCRNGPYRSLRTF